MRLNIFFIIIFFSSVVRSQDTLKYTEVGFFIYNEIPYIDFMPVKKIDLVDPLNSLHNNNFKLGMQFNYYPDVSKEIKLKRILKPLTLDSVMYLTKIIPVELTYYVYYFNPKEKLEWIKNSHILCIGQRKRKVNVIVDFRKEIRPISVKYLYSPDGRILR